VLIGVVLKVCDATLGVWGLWRKSRNCRPYPRLSELGWRGKEQLGSFPPTRELHPPPIWSPPQNSPFHLRKLAPCVLPLVLAIDVASRTAQLPTPRRFSNWRELNHQFSTRSYHHHTLSRWLRTREPKSKLRDQNTEIERPTYWPKSNSASTVTNCEDPICDHLRYID
jgi:hypothetical protein